MTTRRETQLKLWEVKEAAWALYGAAFFESGIPALVESICDQVNEELKRLGFDPAVLLK